MQGCILYENWWPMLAAFFYVLIPMPYLFFGGGHIDSYSSGLEAGYASPFSCSCVGKSALVRLRSFLMAPGARDADHQLV